ncbi:MAG TPA: choice-of-anchor tandem repeat GloVer-containing protein, partial [Chthoniobacterales bacterium]|nr:choice-of-anchor tandem repeat GloVer-containing protein [Chthoniobacterales bacterium]
MLPNVLKGAVLGAGLLAVSVHAATIETLASFSQPLSAFPQVRLSDGTFYGADFGTFNGGLSHGAILKIGQNGSLTTLYTFQAATQDEANPTLLIAGADGNLYGATAPRAVGDLNGMIFKLTPAGTFTPIYHFQDGKGTHAIALVQGADGNFYGTAAGDSSGGFF